MITCTFEKGYPAKLRHVVTHAIVEKDGCILLGKRAGDILESGKWGFPGGYLDRDETTEQGVLRELLEETGWRGRVITLFRINSNPNRPHDEGRQNVVFEYLVEALEETGKPDHESSKVEWIPIEKLLQMVSASQRIAFDHGETIQLYLEYRKKQFPLPLVV